jgi:tRNA A-37 threonylcarbamoyl transferase component Bud32
MSTSNSPSQAPSQDLSSGLQQLVDRFEEAWQSGQRPQINDFLPPEGLGRRAVLAELIHVDLERRLKTHEAVRVEQYLERYPELAADQAVVLNLLQSEFALRRRSELELSLDDYLQRFPSLGEALLARLGADQPPSSPLVSTIEENPTLPPPGDGDQDAGTGSERTETSRAWPTVPGYEIVGELGRGGMGVVYKARQVKLNRLVAVKMILAGAHAGPEELARFRTEAEAIACLQHPHIVQIHEVGEQEGRRYFSLEFVDGASLEKKINGTPWHGGRAAALVEILARAMHAAHQRGIIHRDLKPSNVLLTVDGTPKITDFGLAKRLNVERGQTQSGAILGTPSYMAPEQTESANKKVGPAADIYSLGAILYELLTGRPPFRAETPWETVRQVVAEEPVPPRRMQMKLPRDLETITLKCLHKEPAKRYASAQALADDLRRFLAGEPVHARPIGQLERSWRWCRRNRAVAGLLAAVMLSMVLGTIAASFFALRATSQKERAERLVYYGQIALAQREWQDNEVAHARALLDACRPDLRGWEHAYLRRLCNSKEQTFQGHAGPVNSVAFSPDGKRIVSGSQDRTLRVWDAETGKETLTLKGHTDPVNSAAFSPDGKRIVSGSADGTVKVWDAETGHETITLKGHTGEVFSVAFSPDGKRIASGCSDKILVWDARMDQ